MQRRLEQMQVKARIARQLRTFHPTIRKTLVENLSELVAAVAQAQHVHLSKIAEKLNRDGDEQSREQWVRRQLKNESMGSLEIFKPMVQCLLRGLVGQALYLILDPTELDADHSTVMIMLAYRGRALPVIWKNFEITPGAIGQSVTELFAELRSWLPEGSRVFLLADREFHGVDLLELIGVQGWIPVARGMGTTTVTLADGTPHPLSDLTPPVGQMAFYDGVALTAQQVGAFSLSISCAPPQPGKKLADSTVFCGLGMMVGDSAHFRSLFQVVDRNTPYFLPQSGTS